jgi:hydrogenase nickel incorporation protein HypA/HybF
MHEYSIVEALLDRVDEEARKHAATEVHRVRVAIGELAGVDADLLITAYATIRRGTSCHAAELEVRRVQARWQCPQCQTDIPRGAALRCAACARPARLTAGDEIMLDQIEMEAA